MNDPTSPVPPTATQHPAGGTGTTHRIDVPMVERRGRPEPPLTANQRLHHMQRHHHTKLIRHSVAWTAKAGGIEPCTHLTVGLHYQPGDRRRRDPSNLMPTQKPAVDALVDAGLVPDDTPHYVTELMPVIHPGPGERRLWLEVEITTV